MSLVAGVGGVVTVDTVLFPNEYWLATVPVAFSMPTVALFPCCLAMRNYLHARAPVTSKAVERVQWNHGGRMKRTLLTAGVVLALALSANAQARRGT